MRVRALWDTAAVLRSALRGAIHPHAPGAPPPCWGIGLGRTGTTSLCRALSVLGYRNVVHNPRFEELRYLDGGADNGVTLFYKYLDHKFPGSRFVLTTRRLEDWLPSMKATTDSRPIDREQDLSIQRRMLLYDAVAFDAPKFIRGYHRHHEAVREYFRERPGDLLEMDITQGEGWEKLCPFLGLPVPTEPFPRLNTRG